MPQYVITTRSSQGEILHQEKTKQIPLRLAKRRAKANMDRILSTAQQSTTVWGKWMKDASLAGLWTRFVRKKVDEISTEWRQDILEQTPECSECGHLVSKHILARGGECSLCSCGHGVYPPAQDVIRYLRTEERNLANSRSRGG